MQRTPHDQRSALGRFRVYSKARIVEDAVRSLHDGGPWFVEPADWAELRPYAPGYATAEEARMQAEVWEESTQVR